MCSGLHGITSQKRRVCSAEQVQHTQSAGCGPEDMLSVVLDVGTNISEGRAATFLRAEGVGIRVQQDCPFKD
jgi:hypothetical protein